MQEQIAMGAPDVTSTASAIRAEDAPRYYRPELDVLRLFAFFMVFLSHVVPGDETFFARAHIAPEVADVIIAASAGGAFGVDLFFALSSFLITSLLLRERQLCGNIDVPRFYVRRILRIWPLYFAFLVSASVLAKYVVADESFPLKYLVSFVLLSGNWAFVVWGYPHSVSTPLWSVSIEEQFYLSWPLLMRRWAHHLAIVAFALLAVSFLTRLLLVLHGAIHPQIWCNTLARLDPIACGALLALRTERVGLDPSRSLRVALLLFGFAVLTAAGRYGDVVGKIALLTYPAVTIGCIALILGTLGFQLSARPRGLVRALAYLGRISYGLYVYHLLFIEIFAVPVTHSPIARLTRTAAALLSTIAVAILSYHLLEAPFLRTKEKFAHVRSRPV